MAIRQKAFNAIIGAFERHGAVQIDTPVFELKVSYIYPIVKDFLIFTIEFMPL